MWQLLLTVCALSGSEVSCATGALPFEFENENLCKAAAFYVTLTKEEVEAKEKASGIPMVALPEGKCVRMEKS